MRKSKFIGKVYDGYEVIYAHQNKQYSYEKDNGKKGHASYNFVLVNYSDRKSITLSGNTLRRVNNEEISIVSMLKTSASFSTNPYILDQIKNRKIKGD